MPTLKYYLQNANANFTPATKRGAWDSVAGLADCDLGAAPSGAADSVTVTVNSTTADYDWGMTRLTSAPLASDTTFTGNFNACIGIRQSNAALNARLHIYLYVLQGASGDTPRGSPLLNDFIENTGHYLGVVQADAGQAVVDEAMTEVAALAGDTVVLEIGVRCSADADTYTAKAWRGSTNASPDLEEGGTYCDGALYPGWIALDYDFAPVLAGSQVANDITITWS